MDGFAVSLLLIIQGSAGFSDLRDWAQNIYRGLIGSCDAFGGMAGDDDAGQAFASRYDAAADAVVNGFGLVVAQLGGTSNGLYATAMIYARAEEDILGRLNAPAEVPAASSPDCDQEPKSAELPTAAGHGNWSTGPGPSRRLPPSPGPRPRSPPPARSTRWRLTNSALTWSTWRRSPEGSLSARPP